MNYENYFFLIWRNLINICLHFQSIINLLVIIVIMIMLSTSEKQHFSTMRVFFFLIMQFSKELDNMQRNLISE